MSCELISRLLSYTEKVVRNEIEDLKINGRIGKYPYQVTTEEQYRKVAKGMLNLMTASEINREYKYYRIHKKHLTLFEGVNLKSFSFAQAKKLMDNLSDLIERMKKIEKGST